MLHFSTSILFYCMCTKHYTCNYVHLHAIICQLMLTPFGAHPVCIYTCVYMCEWPQLKLQVPLGVLTKSEQLGDDMIDILTFVHKYVPRKPNGDLISIFFGGDQLTRERAGGAQDARLQAPDSERRLQGVKPKIEDWHALVTFYQVHVHVHQLHRRILRSY